MAIRKNEPANEKNVQVPTFTRRQLMESARYGQNRDFIAALLKDDQMYTFEQVDAMITDAMSGKR